ncbi:MAG TPA: hypothetical protein VL326_04000 [Kofleriaceae bacterium]|nr:hypothetical protein [Kofleriaceae bacterium]
MRLSIAIVALLATSAAAETAPTGNVLVWADAPMYLDPGDSGPSVRVATLDLGREKDVGYVFPMKVVGTSGDFLEVEPTADVECAWWRMIKPDGLDTVHLYVKRADLAPVLVKPHKATHKDGTSVALQIGVPVLAGKVAFNRGVVPVAIPEASLGVTYAPHKIAAVPKPGKTKFLLDEATEVTLGDASFPLGPWVAAAAKPKKQRMLVSIAARCMSAVVSAPKDRVHAGVAINSAVDDKTAPTRPATSGVNYLPAGTKMMSEKGEHVVGTLDADRVVVKPKPGARACADFVITRDDPFVDVPHTVDTPQPQRTLKLCAAGDAVKTK